MSRRSKRVGSLVKGQLGNIIFRELDFGNSLVTITAVETSEDIQHATVKISVYPSSSKKQALSKLQNNIYKLQKSLDKKLQMRPVPKIRFELDRTGEKVEEITKALKQVEKDKKGEDDS